MTFGTCPNDCRSTELRIAMRVLVSAASRHGSTAEVATHIADILRAGLSGDVDVDVMAAADVGETASYDTVILGSAVYLGRWLEDTRKLAQRIAADRSGSQRIAADRSGSQRIAADPPRPVWLFSVGPIGDPPEPDAEPAEVGDIVRTTQARGHRLFARRT
jgi:menaquinone-dependent protoporphyrinogen oxidase